MDATAHTVTMTKDEAFDLFARYFRSFDNSIFAPMLSAMSTKDDEDVFAMMRGSGNEMSVSTMARYILRARNVLSEAETSALVDMEHATRNLEKAA